MKGIKGLFGNGVAPHRSERQGKAPLRYKVSQPPDRIDHVRGFPNSYELTEFGNTVGMAVPNAWERGELVRSGTFVHHLEPMMPMYDPTIMADPNEWSPKN